MLDDEALEQLMRSRRLPEAGRQVVRHIRQSAPSRRVESSKRNVACRYPSRKMGVVIQAESHTNELAAVYTWEHDPEVFEFWDQPPTIPLRYKTADGRPTGASHTPDYFLISKDFMGWVECKTEARLETLGQRQPNRYVRDGDRWRCPPGEAYAADYGLGYRVRSSRDNDWVLIRNLNFLEDYLLPSCPMPSPEQRAAAVEQFRESPWMRLADLIKADPALPADMIYKLIANGDLYFDLRGTLLSDVEHALIFRDKVTADAFAATLPATVTESQVGPMPVGMVSGARMAWDGKSWQILNVGNEGVHLVDTDGQCVMVQQTVLERLIKEGTITGLPEDAGATPRKIIEQKLRAASPAELAEAMERYRVLFPGRDKLPARTCPVRTLSHYRRAYREAERALGCGFVGLLPKISRRGNRKRRVDGAVLEKIEQLMENRYAEPGRERLHSIYGEFALDCRNSGLAKPSEKTFKREVRRLRTHQLEVRRMGDKAAYSMEEFHWELEIGTPRHGERPFEIAHVDHTEMDVTLVHPLTGVNLGRPWLTLLIDAFTRMVLAYVISFSRPNHITCMMIIRECVRRHGRVPRTLVVDGGSEFRSTYFECLLATLEVTKKTRPPSKGHFGSVIERMFGVSNDQFIHNLAGNTQATRNPRSLSPTHDPERHAVWTLRMLAERFNGWLEEYYHQRTHMSLGTSPAQFMKSMTAFHGERSHKWIPYTEAFQIACLPASPGAGKVTVNQVRGVKTQNNRYWHPGFRDPALTGKELQARVDPFNLFHIYVYLKHRWVECLSDRAAEFRLRGADDIRFETEESKAIGAQEPEIREENALKQADFHRQTRKLEQELAAKRRQALDAAEQPEPEPDETGGEFEHAWRPSIDDLNDTIYGDF